jgi:malonyl-CoA/methylmalonyl-CoA synthetase
MRYHLTDMPSLPNLPIFEALLKHDSDSTAIVESKAQLSFTYGDLLQDVAIASNDLQKRMGKSLRNERIALIIDSGYDFVGSSGISLYRNGTLLIS